MGEEEGHLLGLLGQERLEPLQSAQHKADAQTVVTVIPAIPSQRVAPVLVHLELSRHPGGVWFQGSGARRQG